MKKLFTLTMMQLDDKMDFSFIRNFRSAIFKIILSIIKFALVTVAFYAIFMVCGMLSVFGLSTKIPDTVLAVIFTIIMLMSIITCTVGLTNSLYRSQDNKVLLTLPVEHNEVFFSKFILFFIYELIKNVNFTLPLFIAYGINNGAVFYYYLWVLIGFVLISLIPVVIGALLSIPWLFISAVIDRFKVLQAVIIIVVALGIARIIFSVVSLIPENINLLAQWNTIRQDVIDPFLLKFTSIFVPFYWVTKMVVGGTLAISSNIFTGNTLLYVAGVILVIVVGIALAFVLAKPLFFKMASKQFEFEKKSIFGKRNVVHKKLISPLSQELKRNFRSSKYVTLIMVQLILPALLVFLLNKLYSAMQTSFNGQYMTKAFNMVVLYLTVLSFNNEYAAVYSIDGNARYLEKTRPINPAVLTFSRLVSRLVVSTISVVLAAYLYVDTSGASTLEFICVSLTGSFLSAGHLLWCAEMDIMNPQSDQYATLGMEFNNPNVRNATIYSLLLSVLFAFLVYFLAPSGLDGTFIKLMILSLAFLGFRTYLYFIRVKLYYKER